MYNIRSNQATFTNIAGASSVTDAAVNDLGQVAGFFTPASGPVESFLERAIGSSPSPTRGLPPLRPSGSTTWTR